MRTPELGAKGRIALAFAILLARGSMELASGQGPGPVYAESPTPTPTPTPTRTVTPSPTATPDAWATRIAGAQATGTVLAREVDKAKKLATIQATNAAIQEHLDALRATRTPTPTPTLTEEQIRIKQQAGLWPTNTPIPRPWPIEAVPLEKTGDKDTSREIPWWLIGGVVVLILVAGGGVYVVWRFRDRAERRREEAQQRELGIR